MKSADQVPPRVVEQRVRNRIIEYFDFVSDSRTQEQLEVSHPTINLVNEVFSQWEDWTAFDRENSVELSDVYSSDEKQALEVFHTAWAEAADAVTIAYPKLADVEENASWIALREAAAASLATFARRGKLAEDHTEN